MKFRRYKMLADFEKISQFLINNYKIYNSGGNILQPFWEYAHAHPGFNRNKTHRFGIWEQDGDIIGLVCYETDLGECFLNAKTGHEYLKAIMLNYAEKELALEKDGKKKLVAFVPSFDTEVKNLLVNNAYKKVHEYPMTIYPYEQGFKEVKLPEGFSIITLKEENDFKKINDVLWKGFDHGDEPDDDLDCRMLMQSAPNFREDLTFVVKAPNHEFACFAGMWVDHKNKYAYLEPLATIPKYRKMGLAKAILMEAMKKTKEEGANYCFGGSIDFYFKIGFKKIYTIEIWKKEWN